MEEVKSFVAQFASRNASGSEAILQETWDRLDQMVASLGDVEIHNIDDTLFDSERQPTPYDAEYGYRIFPGEAAIVRVVTFTRK